MRVGVKVAKNEERIFDSFDEAIDYIDTFLPEVEAGTLNSDDIVVEYYGSEKELGS
jgi:hypothetical protein